MIDICIDLETWATSPDAAISAIGAVTSDGAEFYVNVSDYHGRHDPATLRWWLEQGDEARMALVAPRPRPLTNALTSLSSWLRMREAHKEGGARIWAHATFDFPVLHMAYVRAFDHGPPWHYRNLRDLRTLYELSGGRPDVGISTAHHALDDAKHMLREVQECS